ncbi:MAG: beta-ketoacyl synthase N-terminal-like domain-containing protein [Candidatus Cryptobacteroides sp.]
MGRERIYVTGIGAVSAAGPDIGSIVGSLAAGKAFLHPATRFDTALEMPVGEVGLRDNELRDGLGVNAGVISRTSLIGLKAVREAVRDHLGRTGGLIPKRAVFISGTSVGGMDLSEEFWKNRLQDDADFSCLSVHDPGASTLSILANAPESPESASFWSRVLTSTTISTACSSAGNAILLAARMLRAGIVDIAVAGGTDSLCRFTMNGFNSLRILDRELCRPFDESRAGLNLGEGAGYLVLSAGRPDGAYCTLEGWGNAAEAYHQTASTPEGIGPGLSMERALETAGLDPGSISFVNTHGTGTPVNDLAESNAMLRIFGGNVPPFSSLKPYFGHTLGASESLEAAVVCRAISDGDCSMMRSAGFSTPIPDTGLIPYDGSQEVKPVNVLSSAFGFGGNCVSLIFSKI